MPCRIGLRGLVGDIGMAMLLSGLCDCFASRAMTIHKTFRGLRGLCDCFASRAMTYSLQPAEAGFVCVGAISIARYSGAG